MSTEVVHVRMRVLWGAVLVTAGAKMTEPQTVDIPLFVEGDKRPEHMPLMLMSGTVDEILDQIRGALTQAYGLALEVQRRDQVAFIDTAAIGFTDLTPQTPGPVPPPLPLPSPSPSPPTTAPFEVPTTMPASEVPPAVTELAPSKSAPPVFPPAGPTEAYATPPSQPPAP